MRRAVGHTKLVPRRDKARSAANGAMKKPRNEITEKVHARISESMKHNHLRVNRTPPATTVESCMLFSGGSMFTSSVFISPCK